MCSRGQNEEEEAKEGISARKSCTVEIRIQEPVLFQVALKVSDIISICWEIRLLIDSYFL